MADAVIYLDVPEWQIGQDVTVFFPDTMMKKGVCELLKEQEVKNAIVINSLGGRCPKCEKTISRAWECCPYCCQRVKWDG